MMKNLSILTATATVVLSATSADANFQITSNYWRAGTTTGLGGTLSNMVGWRSSSGSGAGVTTTAPSGRNTWTAQGTGASPNYWAYGPGAWNGSALGAENFDIAAASAWQDSNGRGVWSFTEGGTTTTLDTTQSWISVENRHYNELEAASAQLFFDILANGSTGTFTFNLKQAAGLNTSWYLGGPSGGAGASNGSIAAGATSFSITVTQALASDFMLQLGNNMSTNLGNGSFLSQSSGVAYGTAVSVPAPGAIALLGLAGLASRRRR